MCVMKNVILLKFLFLFFAAQSQPITQPLSSGDYWEIDDYQWRLPHVANDNTFPSTISFPNGEIGIAAIKANRIIGANEIHWTLSKVRDVSALEVQFSRDLKTFESAGIVDLLRTAGQEHYVFRHTFYDKNLVYYRLAIMRNGKTLAYTPAVQLLEPENTTKVFPTLVKGSTFYVETSIPYEKLQVLNSASQSVYEKGLSGQTGTITVGLPPLQRGVYFVQLLSDRQFPHVQRIVVN